MKKLLIGVILVIGSMTGIPQADAIKNLVGVQAQCDTTKTGCTAVPMMKVTVLCNQLATCPQTFAVDPSNVLNFYGVNATGVRSTNGGSGAQAIFYKLSQ